MDEVTDLAMDTGKKNRRASDIDAHLKRAFRELEQEALPDRLTGLLDQLRAQDKDSDDGSEEEDSSREARRAMHAGAGGGQA